MSSNNLALVNLVAEENIESATKSYVATFHNMRFSDHFVTNRSVRRRFVVDQCTVREVETRTWTRHSLLLPQNGVQIKESGRRDSNPGPPGPKPGALTKLRYAPCPPSLHIA
jgi:hypothetical protein